MLLLKWHWMRSSNVIYLLFSLTDPLARTVFDSLPVLQRWELSKRGDPSRLQVDFIRRQGNRKNAQQFKLVSGVTYQCALCMCVLPSRWHIAWFLLLCVSHPCALIRASWNPRVVWHNGVCVSVWKLGVIICFQGLADCLRPDGCRRMWRRQLITELHKHFAKKA